MPGPYRPGDTLLARLLLDAPESGIATRAPGHRERLRGSWGAATGPLVVPDRQLAAFGRVALDDDSDTPIDVQVVNTSGAGGLVSLADRLVTGVRIGAVRSALRDLGDLAGNAARVAAAAAQLDDEVVVYVGIPPVPGWERAIDAVEAAGLRAHLQVTDGSGSPEPASSTARPRSGSGPATSAGPGSGSFRGVDPAAATVLADQLSTLIEADLPFVISGWRGPVAALLAAVDALVDDADVQAGAELLTEGDDAALRALVLDWDEPRQTRVRRRLDGVDCPDVDASVRELTAGGLLS